MKKNFIAIGLICAFLPNIFLSTPILASSDVRLPAPGVMVRLSPTFNPSILKGIKVYPDNPFRFDFILDQADELLSSAADLKQKASELIKFFLVSLTIPEKDIWVNLSPYEKDRIVAGNFGQTSMGQTLLAQDYLLKQITASLMFPEDKVGKEFWKRIYAKATETLGTTNIQVNTFNKVWILPQKAVVYEDPKTGMAYVAESKLKVMMEEDYLSLNKNAPAGNKASVTNQLGSQIMREVIIPHLTKEVNEGKNFAELRQVYNSLILATWYKKKIKESILSQIYIGQNKIAGLKTGKDSVSVDKIYQMYLKAFKKGVYNIIKEEPLSAPKKYFSGGVTFDPAVLARNIEIVNKEFKVDSGMVVRMKLDPAGPEKKADAAQLTGYVKEISQRVWEGEDVTLTAVMPANISTDYDIYLHSNRTGEWITESRPWTLEHQGKETLFETTVSVQQTFEYTFKFVHQKTGEVRWADLSYGQGRVLADRKFTGNITFVGMEFRDLMMKGGQGDVNRELTEELVKSGANVSMIMPFFKSERQGYEKKGYKFEDTGIAFAVPIGRDKYPININVKKINIADVDVYLLDTDDEGLFIKPYADADKEFYESILLSHGAAKLLFELGQGDRSKAPDIVQFSDHHAALTPLYMKYIYGDFFGDTARLLTIHNIGYQGVYPNHHVDELGIDFESGYIRDEISRLIYKSGKLNFMAVPPGIAKLEGYRGWGANTVSPTYAYEIRNTLFETDELLNQMGEHFLGILNGLQLKEFIQKTNEILARLDLPQFPQEGRQDSKSKDVVDKKSEIKKWLHGALGKDQPLPDIESNRDIIEKVGYLSGDPGRPLFYSLGRFAGQKQLDIIADILDGIRDNWFQSESFDLVIGGPADREGDDLETMRRLKELANNPVLREKGVNIVVLHGFVNELGYIMNAGADALLMPSDFEPAGTVQLKALPFGTLPIVRETGGLKDTIVEYGPKANGYSFKGVPRTNHHEARAENGRQLHGKMQQAITDFNKDSREIWETKMNNAFREKISWDNAVRDYMNVMTWVRGQMDPAMKTEQNTGGIDFKMDTGFVESRQSNGDIKFNIDPAMIERFKDASGFIPVIIDIRPISVPAQI